MKDHALLPPHMSHPNPSPEGEGLSIRAALTAATSSFAPHGNTSRLDAELLMAHALGTTREELLLRHLDDTVPAAFPALLARREGGQPVAYITGRRGFWTIELEVGPGVLIPRPDSETLIEAAVEHFGTEGPRSVLDLGTGSGALLLAALDQWPKARGTGLDESEEAIRIARRNVRNLGMRDRARIMRGGWTGTGGPYDLILCNPPYIRDGENLPPEVILHEPAEALFGGRDGLDNYRMIAPVLAPQLACGGLACLELGAGQRDAVAALFAAQGFTVSSRRDLGNIERCLLLSR